jgi:hypothetical protein
MGEIVPRGAVPGLTGDFAAPDIEAPESCFASMATSGRPFRFERALFDPES